MAINIKDVANKAGVCVTTVSRILNNQSNVRETNRQKVMQAIALLNYNPNAAARTLARGKSDTLGIVLPTLRDPFWAELVTELEHAAFDWGYVVVLALTKEKNNKQTEQRWVKYFCEGRVDGLLLIAPENENDYILELRNRNFPFVLLDNNLSNLKAPSVIVNNVEGGFLATRHLVELGHKRIGHIGGDLKFQSAKERLKGFYKAMNQSGISVNDAWVKQAGFVFDESFKVTLDWLSKPERPTAIFAADDRIALGIMEAARQLNLNIPRDLSVMGYDNSPYSTQVIPRLTTLQQPTEQMAIKAVQSLVGLIRGKSPRAKIVTLSPELIIRESTERLIY